METEPTIQAEQKRIAALQRYDILDTPSDGAFDRITKLASTLFEVPIAIISLVDTDRIWFKSHHGLSASQIGRDPGLCASAILSNDVYVVNDAKSDPRTLANPLVAGEFGLRFYAAVPLQTDDQYNLGTLCIIDQVPRTLTEKEKLILEQLGRIVMDEMELRLQLRTTVANVKRISADLTSHITETLGHLQNGALPPDSKGVAGHLEASRMFLSNMDSQLDQL
jgi:GAF domain-containing protein